jgi:hypothetical protein
MVVIDAGVDHRHDRRANAGRQVPSLRSIDIGIGRAAGLAGVVQAPLRRQPRIVGDGGDPQRVVRFGIGYQWIVAQSCQGRVDARSDGKMKFPPSSHERASRISLLSHDADKLLTVRSWPQANKQARGMIVAAVDRQLFQAGQ